MGEMRRNDSDLITEYQAGRVDSICEILEGLGLKEEEIYRIETDIILNIKQLSLLFLGELCY